VRSEGDDFIITAAVPGLRAEDVQVEVLAERVTLHADIPAPATDDAEAKLQTVTWLLQERRYGNFTRTLDFPVELDGAHAEAVVENGLLTLRLPKAETAKPKVVKVNAK
jgi:HSP20 family protein